jgi:hypothetical protein
VNAPDPFAPQLPIVHAADEGGVLARHGFLVAIAVERPGLNLSSAQFAAMQKLMERVLVVLALRPDRANRSLERFRRKDIGRRPQRPHLIHRAAPYRHGPFFSITGDWRIGNEADQKEQRRKGFCPTRGGSPSQSLWRSPKTSA